MGKILVQNRDVANAAFQGDAAALQALRPLRVFVLIWVGCRPMSAMEKTAQKPVKVRLTHGESRDGTRMAMSASYPDKHKIKEADNRMVISFYWLG